MTDQREFWRAHRILMIVPIQRGRSKNFGTLLVQSTRKVRLPADAPYFLVPIPLLDPLLIVMKLGVGTEEPPRRLVDVGCRDESVISRNGSVILSHRVGLSSQQPSP
jgi:hypothetical protein